MQSLSVIESAGSKRISRNEHIRVTRERLLSYKKPPRHAMHGVLK